MRDLLLAAAPVLLGSAVFFGPLAAWIARARYRRPGQWVVFGAILGPVAIAILLLAPPGRCPRCSAPIAGWHTACLECGLGVPAAAPAAAGSPSATPSPEQRAERAPERPVSDLQPPAGRARPRRADLYVIRSPSEPPPAESQSMPERVGAIRAVPESFGRHHESGPSGELLATGVFVSGTSQLVAGSRYELTARGDDLLIRGPVDETPDRVRIAHPIEDLDATAVQDDLLISSPAGRSPQLVLGFRALRGRSPEELERLLSHEPTSRAAADAADRADDSDGGTAGEPHGEGAERPPDPDAAPVRRRPAARSGRSRRSRPAPPPSEDGPDRASA